MNISVIIPVHFKNESDKNLFEVAVQSIEHQKIPVGEILYVIHESDKYTSEYFEKKLIDNSIERIVVNKSETNSFQSQVNFGISEAKCEWVSILEFDDQYSEIWFDNVVKYSEHYPKFDVFIPLTINVIANGESNTMIGYSNEAPLANSFSQNLEILDLDSTTAYPNFSIVGSVIRKSIFEKYGMFKEGIKYMYIHEFLMRMLDSGVKMRVIPKIGYSHLVQRKGSISETTSTVNKKEAKFWLDTAKREYHHSKDRLIEYRDFE